eukprot:TRINITY_DN4726_c0_g1_i1.p1 TRINITY_DN4726_c0_g1~~TRINITY_DN4726_c0_g1_i1.p1  ORF type:complete len:125 (+),score=18.43 TRINITY_DN4726_c0_g1_i1:52-426(+)
MESPTRVVLSGETTQKLKILQILLAHDQGPKPTTSEVIDYLCTFIGFDHVTFPVVNDAINPLLDLSKNELLEKVKQECGVLSRAIQRDNSWKLIRLLVKKRTLYSETIPFFNHVVAFFMKQGAE